MRGPAPDSHNNPRRPQFRPRVGKTIGAIRASASKTKSKPQIIRMSAAVPVAGRLTMLACRSSMAAPLPKTFLYFQPWGKLALIRWLNRGSSDPRATN